MGVKWICVTWNGGHDCERTLSEVSKTFCDEIGEDLDLSRCPRSPILHHEIGQKRTSAEIENATRSNHKSRHSVDGHMPEDVLAPVVVPTSLAFEDRGESESGCPDQGDRDGIPSENAGGVSAVDLCVDFWGRKWPVCPGGVTTCHGMGCVFHPEDWLCEWWPVGL